MKNTFLVLLAFVCACTKQNDIVKSESLSKTPEKCFFGQTSFNLNKRTPQPVGELAQVARPKGQPSSSANPSAVILLDFNGHYLANTYWNVNGDINCAPANLSVTEQEKILDIVGEDFRPFNVLVTTDEYAYSNANIYKRMRVIITETWEWYGQAGGTSYIGSFTWGEEQPCFVFSSLLNYNTKQIAEASSHEAGHTLGLRHQASYDPACGFLSEYNYGQGEGRLSWAPVMGVGYYKAMTTWHDGPNPWGCLALQDDVSVLTSVLGIKTDDHSNTTNGATLISTYKEGIITANSDVDFFYVNSNTEKAIAVQPFSTTDNQGVNLDIQIRVYSTNGTLLNSINDQDLPGVSTTLGAGKFFIAVSGTGNEYAKNYGMLGKYMVTVN